MGRELVASAQANLADEATIQSVIRQAYAPDTCPGASNRNFQDQSNWKL